MMTSYPKARDISIYLEAFPLFRKPKHIGEYSIDGNGEYQDDDSEMKYLKMDHLQTIHKPLHKPLDLTFREDRYVGFKKSTWFPLQILVWIKNHKKQVWLEDEKRLNEDFVTSGGTFKRIFLAPYSNSSQVFTIYKLNETFYILAKREEVDVTPGAQALSNIGHKFELLLTSEDPDGEPHSDDVIVNENQKYYHVKKSKISHYHVIYSVNIDCVEMVTSDSGKTEENGIEITVLRNSILDIDSFKFKRYRLLKMWCDAFATGIDKTICGFRGQSDIVTHLKIFETKFLSQNAMTGIAPHQKIRMWRPQVCANFADAFLDFLKASDIKERKLYRVTYCMDGELALSQAEEDLTKPFIPEWYCKEFGNFENS